MSRVILFSNQKGGVGKTTLTRETGYYLASQNHRVLLIDCDGQGNLSKGVAAAAGPGLYEALEGEEPNFKEVSENLYLLSGDNRLSALEKRLTGELDAFTRLKSLLENDEFSGFDYILLDTPPSLGTLTINALAVSTDLVIPMSPALYTLQGTNDLVDTVGKVRKSLNPDLNILGVIINGYDSVPVITREIRSEIEDAFGERVFNTVLPKSIKIEEAIAQKVSVLSLKSSKQSSKVQEAVKAIGAELLSRLGVSV